MKRARLRWIIAVAAGLAVPLLPSIGAAAEPRAVDLEAARLLFQEATALERQSAWQEASQKLDAALAIKETPGLHFHRAHCAEQLGELVLAARHYARSEEMIRAGAAAPDVEELLSAARARVLARVPRLTLSFPNDVVGASLEIDGVQVTDQPGSPVLLDPGRHRIIARAPGRRDFEMEITLVEGQTQTLEVSLAPPRSAPESSTPAQRRRQEHDGPTLGTREVVLIGEATLALAGLGTGIGFSVAKGSASDRIEQAQRAVDASAAGEGSGCQTDSPPPACAELRSALEDHDRATRFATVGFVTAGVGAAATLLTFVLWPSRERPVTAGVERSSSGPTLSVRGRF
jgi:hypothetical protein